MLTNAWETANSHCNRMCHTASRMANQEGRLCTLRGFSCKLLMSGEWHKHCEVWHCPLRHNLGQKTTDNAHVSRDSTCMRKKDSHLTLGASRGLLVLQTECLMEMDTVRLCMHLEDLPQGSRLNFLIVSVTGTGYKVQGVRVSHQLLLQSCRHRDVDHQGARVSSPALRHFVSGLPVL